MHTIHRCDCMDRHLRVVCAAEIVALLQRTALISVPVATLPRSHPHTRFARRAISHHSPHHFRGRASPTGRASTFLSSSACLLLSFPRLHLRPLPRLRDFSVAALLLPKLQKPGRPNRRLPGSAELSSLDSLSFVDFAGRQSVINAVGVLTAGSSLVYAKSNWKA